MDVNNIIIPIFHCFVYNNKRAKWPKITHLSFLTLKLRYLLKAGQVPMSAGVGPILSPGA